MEGSGRELFQGMITGSSRRESVQLRYKIQDYIRVKTGNVKSAVFRIETP
jgi:hypothetical protein